MSLSPDETSKRLRGYQLGDRTTTQPIIPPASIHSLSQEALLHIFSYVGLAHLCNVVPRVCRQWERLHWDPHLYGILEGGTTFDDIFACLEGPLCVLLTSPYFNQEHITTLLNKCVQIHNDKTLSNKNVHEFDRVFYKEFIVLLAHVRKVQFLFGTPCNINCSILPLLRSCVQLRELTISGYYRVTSAELTEICAQLGDTLRVLHVDCKDWSLEGVHAIGRCQHLKDLALLGVRDISEECLQVIGHISSLRTLRFDDCFRYPINALSLMFISTSLRHLTSLSLTNCSYNDVVLIAIGWNLKNLRKLSLNGRRTFVRPNCLVPTRPASLLSDGVLDRIITGCSKLKVLEIVCSGQNPSAGSLLMIPKYLPGLEELRVVCPGLPELEWKAAIRREMPRLVIWTSAVHMTRIPGLP